MKSIKQILMDRDGLTAKEADDLIAEANEDFQDRLTEGEMPFNICEEYFGLEPDYLEELF